MTPAQFFLDYGFYGYLAAQCALVLIWAWKRDPDGKRGLGERLRELKKWRA